MIGSPKLTERVYIASKKYSLKTHILKLFLLVFQGMESESKMWNAVFLVTQNRKKLWGFLSKNISLTFIFIQLANTWVLQLSSLLSWTDKCPADAASLPNSIWRRTAQKIYLPSTVIIRCMFTFYRHFGLLRWQSWIIN